MKIHEIERHQTHPEHLEITLYLDPDLLWFKGHLLSSPCSLALHNSTG